MTSMSRNDAAGCDATCGFCARVYFSHPSSSTTTTTTAATAAEGGHVHRTHLHTRCCRSVRELLATLQHVDLAQHLRVGGGGRASTRAAAAAAAVDKNNSNNNSSADNDEAASQSFFWIDMHGCPCVEDVSLARVWSLLGLHARTQRRLAHSTHNDTTAAAAAAADGGDDNVVDGAQPRDTATMASGDSGCTHVSNNTTTTTTTMSSAPPVRSMFDEHVYYEIDMDEPDTVQLLPLAGLSPADDNADSNSTTTTTTTAYYVAMQLAALMEQYVLPSRADAHDAAWMAPVSENVSFADEHIHNLTHPHDDVHNNNNDCHRQATTTTTMHVPHHHHNNNSSKHDHCDNARAVDVWAGGEGALTTGQPQRARTTVITTAHVLCFAQGCVTWCPSSNMPVRTNDEDDGNNKDNNREATTATTAAAAAASSTREGERVCQHVKDWSKLQEAVLARLRRSAHDNSDNKDNSESSCCGGSSPAASSSLSSATAAARDITTTEFIALLMSTLCYGFLPDATAALGEVDEVDAMLPTVVPEREVEQATALHRILVQRRRLSMLRRLLYRKVRLMEELDKPVMHTLAAFMAAIVPRTRTRHGNGGNSSSAANLPSQSHATRRGQHDGDCSRHHGATALVMRASSSSSSAVAHSTYDVMVQFIAKLDAARLTLGNLTLVYTSAVTSRNSRTSTGTDLYQLILQYMIITVLPLSMVASHWGMNCNVPWKDSETTTPFWGLTGMMFGLMLLMLVYPMWAYKTERYQYIM